MRLNNVDLNLFLVFDTIYTERNITRAAEVLCISQSAVSQALSRLRKTLNDPLFVRGPQGMAPTPLATHIASQVRDGLQLLASSVHTADPFEAASSDRVFRISLMDMSEDIFLPALVDLLQEQAPHMTVESHYIRRPDIARALASGELDFAIDIPHPNSADLCQETLFDEPYVCLVRRDHPVVQGSLSLEQYLALAHIHVSQRRRGIGQVDVELNKQGCKRRIKFRVQHYHVASKIVGRSDVALTVPRCWAESFERQVLDNLQVLELPFAAPTLNWQLFWHRGADEDPANRWFREAIVSLAAP